MGRRSKYPEEFRREAVRLVLTTDKSMAEVLEISASTTRPSATGSGRKRTARTVMPPPGRSARASAPS